MMYIIGFNNSREKYSEHPISDLFPNYEIQVLGTVAKEAQAFLFPHQHSLFVGLIPNYKV